MKDFKTPVSIKVNGKKEQKAVIKKLESMGYMWNSGDRPTEHCYGDATFLTVFDSYIIYTTNKKPNTKKVITAAEFLGESKETIVIYRNGSETVALDKTTGKKAVAKCSPEDTYDFYTGAKLAFERLTEKAEQKEHPSPLYNGKVVCTRVYVNKTLYTRGKVYQFENGLLTADNGRKYPDESIPVHTFEEWVKWTSSDFIEIVE